MSTVKYTPRLAEKYKKEVVPALMKKFGYSTIMQAPKLEKICINRGVNGAVTDKKWWKWRWKSCEDHGSEGGDHPVEEGYLQLQAAEEHADRCAGNAAWREDVRVPGTAVAATAFPGYGTSRGSMRSRSMAGGIIPSVSPSRSFSPRSTSTR